MSPTWAAAKNATYRINYKLLYKPVGTGRGIKDVYPGLAALAVDVVEAIEGDLVPVPCVEDSEPCARKSSCIAARVWKKLADDMAASLSSFTLAELARQAREMGEPVPNYSI